jgi:hypothetical protein
MITCPLCHQHVHLDNDGRDTNTLLTDNDTSDFYCPTYVDVHQGVRWSHYTRRHVTNSTELKYIATIPPFDIWWTNQEQYLLVRQFNIVADDFRFNKIIYEEENVPFDKIKDIYQRFITLRAFT